MICDEVELTDAADGHAEATELQRPPEERGSEAPSGGRSSMARAESSLKRGFDAASMGEIAREAGVSKGTLYVYFKSKEELFEAIVEGQCGLQGERIFTVQRRRPRRGGRADAAWRCVRAFHVPPGRISPLRTVIAIADRMPELGRQVLSVRPARGISTSRPISRVRWRPAY